MNIRLVSVCKGNLVTLSCENYYPVLFLCSECSHFLIYFQSVKFTPSTFKRSGIILFRCRKVGSNILKYFVFMYLLLSVFWIAIRINFPLLDKVWFLTAQPSPAPRSLLSMPTHAYLFSVPLKYLFFAHHFPKELTLSRPGTALLPEYLFLNWRQTTENCGSVNCKYSFLDLPTNRDTEQGLINNVYRHQSKISSSEKLDL
jgi:hypothetical protein